MIDLLLRCYPPAGVPGTGRSSPRSSPSGPLGPFDVRGRAAGSVRCAACTCAASMARRTHGAVVTDVSSRLGGWAAIVGGILWLLVFFLSATTTEGGDPS